MFRRGTLQDLVLLLYYLSSKSSEVLAWNFARFEFATILSFFKLAKFWHGTSQDLVLLLYYLSSKNSEVQTWNFARFGFATILSFSKLAKFIWGTSLVFFLCYYIIQVLYISDNIVSTKCIYCYNKNTPYVFVLASYIS